MTTQIGQNWRPDGHVRYRTDSVGARVAVLPRTCKRRLHDLAVAYQAIEVDGELRVTCLACSKAPRPDHTWHLITTPPLPDRAELDDGPYADIEPVLGEVSIRGDGTRSS